jgi:8-oxo-dGTP diphosphatase
MVAKPIVRVVAALIEQNGKFLITQRRPEATLPLLWEFPGGRVEMGESDQAALVRELQEEMEVDLEVDEKVFEVTREYERYFIELATYSCKLVRPHIRPIRVHDYRWVGREEFAEYEFPGADQVTVDKLLKGK